MHVQQQQEQGGGAAAGAEPAAAGGGGGIGQGPPGAAEEGRFADAAKVCTCVYSGGTEATCDESGPI